MSDDDNAHEALVKSGNAFAARFIYQFAWFWALASVIYFFAITFLPIPEAGKDFANIILGFLLGTAVSTVINYFFGSSGE
jgi:hypothetical protein